MADATGVPIQADTASLNRLAHDLVAASPAVWAECRIALKAAGEVVAQDARQRAAFSTKVPQSIHTLPVRLGSIKVQAGGELAPNAAALESGGRGHPRHPLFGNRNYWYTNNTPAFLAPALDAKREVVAEMIVTAVSNATDRAIRESH